jgi:flavin-dependent dehydrogenase
MSERVTIYGAGLSGLVAAINLARDGQEVLVHEKEKGFGGDSLYNPSTHTTPINIQKTSDYIGIDISSAFNPVIACPFYFHDTKALAPVSGLYTVERGNRKTSLDSILFKEAKKLGVKFEFGSALKKNDIATLEPGTIIACGLTPGVYDMLEVPYRRWYGWISRGEIGFSGYSWIWLDESISEYGYLSSANNYYFNLLFSIYPVPKSALTKYRDFMKRKEGIEHDDWQYASGAVPVASPDNPRLIKDGLIYCGTISGMMDPVGWFGILGALISGRIAAMAISDRQKALEEFARFNRLYKPFYYFKNSFWYRVRPHVGLLESCLKMAGIERIENLAARFVGADKHVPFSIPGFAHLGCF